MENQGGKSSSSPRYQLISTSEDQDKKSLSPRKLKDCSVANDEIVDLGKNIPAEIQYLPIPNQEYTDESIFEEISDKEINNFLSIPDKNDTKNIEKIKNSTEKNISINSPSQILSNLQIIINNTPVLLKPVVPKILSENFDTGMSNPSLYNSIEQHNLIIQGIHAKNNENLEKSQKYFGRIEQHNLIIQEIHPKNNENLEKSQKYFGRALMSINFIESSCLFKLEKSCNNCRKQVLPLQKLKQNTIFQPFKISNKNCQGIRPFCTNGSEEIIDCEFLNNWIENPGKCKFLINVAMCDENCEDVWDTLQGCINNLEYFFTDKKRSIKEEEIGIMIIVDGIEPFLKTFYNIEGARMHYKGCFQKNRTFFSQFFNDKIIKDELMTKSLVDKDPNYEFVVIKELFEAGLITKGQEIAYTFCQKIKFLDNHYLNTIFCVTQLNKRRLNTHKWFFKGFCHRIKPKYIALLDAGVIPKSKGLFYLYEAMEKDNRVAGCCGEIVPSNKSLNPIVQAQIVEYKFSHIMDRALESIIGYVSILPGSFSAYRWERLDNDDILKAYFYSHRKWDAMNIFTASMHLIQDRILCMELICQKNQYNILRYVKWSTAKSKVPDSLNELLAQRRRWINGLWFSMIFTVRNCNRIRNSKHSYIRKCFFKTLMVYYSIMALFNWLMVGAFYLTFTLAIKRNLNEEDPKIDKLRKRSTPIIVLYTSILISMIIISMGVKPRRVETLFKFFSILLGIFSYGSMFIVFYFIFGDIISGNQLLTFDFNYWIHNITGSLAIIGGAIFLISLLLNFNHSFIPVIKGIPFFLFMIGTYINMFMIYAICNIHDFSLGNRPDKLIESEKKYIFQHKNERTIWLILWIFCNAAFAYFLNLLNSSDDNTKKAYIDILALVVYFVIGFKVIGGILFVFDEWCCCCLHEKLEQNHNIN
ncbi:hypothetical protein SteCoe_513 [Stentor coeruleus]|uniref:chitin synthase n=1 Tax=Stentor coeruleus TaxID=5963 RepID=A0A1R2D3X2_9CILI|nr:hypothetical protein SteCoe_513 [Stentor coeruleus]